MQAESNYIRSVPFLLDEGDATVKKSLIATLMAVLLCAVFATPAFAGTMNSNETEIYNKFCNCVDSKVPQLLGEQRAGSFKGWAEKTLTNDEIDLDKAACDELNAKLDEVMAYIDDPANGIVDRPTASAAYPTIAKMINEVSEKYGMTVVVENTLKDGKVLVNGKVVGDTKNTVNQTGFGLTQTVVVSAAAVATLCGAYFVARKNRLFA